MSDGGSNQRREVYYSGRVQGVGFRYTVRGVAGRFAVSGFVKNLPDGRVHLVAEGLGGELGRFLAAVDDALGRYVTAIQQETGPAIDQFDSFEIRF